MTINYNSKGSLSAALHWQINFHRQMMFQMEPAKWGGLCLPKVHQEEVVLVFTTGVSLSSAKVHQLHSPDDEKWNDLLVLPMAGSTKTYKSDLLNMSRLVIHPLLNTPLIIWFQ